MVKQQPVVQKSGFESGISEAHDIMLVLDVLPLKMALRHGPASEGH